MNSNFEERFKKIETRLDAIEKLLQNKPVSTPSKKMSAKEFLLEKKPKSVLEIAFLLGYFLEKVELKESFGVDDLKSAFKVAKIPPPKNINDVVNKNISKGYFMDAGKVEGKKRWTLTATGEKYVESGVNNE